MDGVFPYFTGFGTPHTFHVYKLVVNKYEQGTEGIRVKDQGSTLAVKTMQPFFSMTTQSERTMA
jgi:hypothetical protein